MNKIYSKKNWEITHFYIFFYYSLRSQDRRQFTSSVGHRTQKIVSFPARKSQLLRIAAQQSCRPVVLHFGTPGSNRRQISGDSNGQNYAQQFVLHEFGRLRVDQWGECTAKSVECDVSDPATTRLQQLASIGPAVCWEELACMRVFFSFNEFIFFKLGQYIEVFYIFQICIDIIWVSVKYCDWRFG